MNARAELLLEATPAAESKMRGSSSARRIGVSAVTIVAAAGTVALAALPSSAADYPAQPIRIIVGFAAGGAPDTLARIIGDELARDWGQPVVVDNRTGVQGNIAMAAVARA